jgi:hypothetical protein
VALVVGVVPFVGVPEEVGAARAVPASDGVHSDFNGDGFSDLAIGVPNEDVGEVFDAGAVEVIYGSAGGLQLTAPGDDFISQDSPGVRDSAEETDLFGYTVAAGDFNDDGFADLAVGIYSEGDGGGVAVLYGVRRAAGPEPRRPAVDPGQPACPTTHPRPATTSAERSRRRTSTATGSWTSSRRCGGWPAPTGSII